MKLASIVPVKDIHRTFSGEYTMLLAHLQGCYPRLIDRKHYNGYIIMDNSLIELGGAVDIQTVLEAALACGADEMILPDVFLDGYATLKKVRESIEYLRNIGALHTIRLMAVCHGKTVSEFEYCFRELEKMPEIHCIGIPKITSKTFAEGGGRPSLEYLWQGSPKAIHLLGCWSTLSELYEYENPGAIRSIDTSLPALLSTRGKINPYDERKETEVIDLNTAEVDDYRYEAMIEKLKEDGWL